MSLRACFLLFLTGISPLFSETREVEYKEIPAKFEQYQDKAGFLWQTNQKGALTSGETQYLPSGMKLFCNGEAFEPQSGTLSDNSDAEIIDLQLKGKYKALSIERQFWFDLERGGVRVLDTIKNSGGNTKVKVELKTAFQFPWQNLVGTSGEILSGTSQVELSPRDHGITAKFSATDGRQDTVILVRGDAEGGSPAISASSNSRELVLTYDLSIPGNQTRSLVHWIMRRNIGQVDEINRIASSFYERNHLIDSRVPRSLVKTIQNFPASAFPKELGPPENLNRLVALNELLARLEVKRKNQDVLWMNSVNQLVGDLSEKGLIQKGAESIPIAKIAAIQGGGGVGRTPRIFMRDGSVLAGEIELKNFALKVGETWAVDKWNADELNLLLLGYDQSDGITSAKAKSFVELRTGEVFAVRDVVPDIPLISVWGRRVVKLDQIEEFQYLSQPWPEYRLAHSDGSSISVLPSREPLEFGLASGKIQTFDPRMIRRIWKNGVTPSPPDRYKTRWIELRDVPEELMPSKGFILRGNNLYAGGFVEGASITVVDGNSALDISPSEIVAMRKITPSLRTALPQFEFELGNGNLIKGGITQTTLRIGSPEESWQVPVRHIIAYQSALEQEGGER